MRITEFPRRVDYLRISVTDRCNLRCMYCMPEEGIKTVSHEHLLTFEEIVRVAKICAGLGVKKIRLTGGEPLLRKDITSLVESLANIEGVEEVALTTNGILLPSHIGSLKSAGLKRINISLDTLNREKFKRITREDSLFEVLKGVELAKTAGFYPLKLNMVVMKGVNDDEIIDFVNFSLSHGLVLRFIEFLKGTPFWRENHFVSAEEVKKTCEERFKLRKVDDEHCGPAQYYEIEGSNRLGFIETSKYNCRRCTRLRLTSKGELKVCLFEDEGLLLKSFLRDNACDEVLENVIRARLGTKEKVDYAHWYQPSVYMSNVGG